MLHLCYQWPGRLGQYLQKEILAKWISNHQPCGFTPENKHACISSYSLMLEHLIRLHARLHLTLTPSG